MEYKVGDKVRIKSLDWYNDNKDSFGSVPIGDKKPKFTYAMSKYCGMVLTIDDHTEYDGEYYMIEDDGVYVWADEMIEGLVEEENEKKLSDESWRYKNIFDHSQYPQSFELPEGYIFKDENGNVINAQKIVLEKQKKEYPKTYEECVMLLRLGVVNELKYRNLSDVYKKDLIVSIQKLFICRDAYWRVAGEEMGLGKPWSPNDADYVTGRHCIFVHQGNIICSTPAEDCPLTFPTEEMRDAFYENFKKEIEICKELL